MIKIVIPTECPTCSSSLEMVNGQLFCRNKDCLAQSSKTLEGFCKKMKIKGFGAKTLEKLELQSIPDLYELEYTDIEPVLGSKMATKLLDELNKATDCEFSQFLGSLGINLIGAVAAQKIATKCNRLVDITESICKDAKLGDKATESLLNWLASETGIEVLDTVDSYIIFKEKTVVTQKVTLGIEVCITGKLNDFPNRNTATEYLEQFGITVKNSVTKSVKYLICEDETKVGSSSYKKAQANGIQILTIKKLIEIIGE